MFPGISKLGFTQGSLDRQGVVPEKLWEESLYRIFQLREWVDIVLNIV